MTPGDESKEITRIFDAFEDLFRPGDVYVTTFGENTLAAEDPAGIGVSILLGGGKVLTHTAEGTAIRTFAETVAVFAKENLALLLRPTFQI